MQHLARARGVPLSLPNGPGRAYIGGVRASLLSVLANPSDASNIAGAFFEKRTLPGPLFYLGPTLRQTKQRVNESAGCFTKRETALC